MKMIKPTILFPLLLVLLLFYSTGCSSMHPIHKATDQGSLKKVGTLLDSGADVNEVQPLYGTPLWIAVENRDVKMAELLLKRGADAKYIGESSMSLLCAAVVGENVEMVELLLGAGADVNDACRNISPVARAAGSGDVEMVGFLVERGADIRHGYPVALAARNGHLQVASFLISKGANVSCPPKYGLYGLSTIEQAVASGNSKMVDLILSAGADPNCGDALASTVNLGQEEILQKIRDAGATEKGDGQVSNPAK